MAAGKRILNTSPQCATSCGFDFIVAPLVNCDRNTAEASAAPPSAPGLVKAPFPLDDIVVAHLNWSSQVCLLTRREYPLCTTQHV